MLSVKTKEKYTSLTHLAIRYTVDQMFILFHKTKLLQLIDFPYS